MFDYGFPETWSTIKKLAWLRMTALANALVTIGPASILSFLSNKVKPIDALTVTLSPIQSLNGYDAPWPAGGGKNLFNVDAVENTSASNGTITNNGDGTLTVHYISGSSAMTTGKNLRELADLVVGETYYLSATTTGNKYLYLNTYGATWPFNTSRTVTQEMLDSTVFLYAGNTADTYATISEIQIEKGNSKTSWTPYSNICPISGHTEVNVWRTGTNVWDEEWEQGGYDENSGAEIAAGNISTQRCKHGIAVKPNTAYYFKCDTTLGTNPSVMVCEYDASGAYLGCFYKYVWAFSFTTKATTALLKFRVYNTNISELGGAGNLSINYPSTDTDYHAYTGLTIPITIPTPPGTVYGGTLDVISGVLTVDRVKHVFDGTETQRNSQAGTYGYRYGFVLDGAKIPSTIPERSDFQCNIGAANADTVTAGRWTPGMCLIYPLTSQGIANFMFVVPLEYNTPALAAQYLIDNGLEICYQLAEPQTYQLTPQEVLALQGQNVVWTDAGEVTLTAKGITPITP